MAQRKKVVKRPSRSKKMAPKNLTLLKLEKQIKALQINDKPESKLLINTGGTVVNM